MAQYWILEPIRMMHFDGAQLRAGLDMRALINRIVREMRERPATPLRQRVQDSAGREMLVMPAMLGTYAGVKSLTLVPKNRNTARPVISGLFTLFSLETGEALATMDAGELTARRTSAVSAAAAERLARADASTLTLLGAGHLAPFMAAAHALVRPVRHIKLWARDQDKARAAASKAEALFATDQPPAIEVVADLESAIRSSDIVSAATGAAVPIIRGEWLRAGTHVDLVGSYRPDMREIDDNGITRAQIFVDDRDASLREAGDLTDPIGRGVLSADAIHGDLSDLCAGTVGRSSNDAVTLFKAVGIGSADLIAAIEAWERISPLK
jgi:ornithine cyclodeaminase